MEDVVTMPCLPDLATVRAVALEAELRNPHPLARSWLLEKIDRPPADWDERAVLTIPGVVWTVKSFSVTPVMCSPSPERTATLGIGSSQQPVAGRA